MNLTEVGWVTDIVNRRYLLVQHRSLKGSVSLVVMDNQLYA